VISPQDRSEVARVYTGSVFADMMDLFRHPSLVKSEHQSVGSNVMAQVPDIPIAVTLTGCPFPASILSDDELVEKTVQYVHILSVSVPQL
jgi:hypothetical protein